MIAATPKQRRPQGPDRLKVLIVLDRWSRTAVMMTMLMMLLSTTLWCSVVLVDGFAPLYFCEGNAHSVCQSHTLQSTTALFAAKKKKKRPSDGGSSCNSKSSGGFGGAAMEACPCGSGETYASCCGKLHRDVTSFRMATPEQVARARYAAWAKKQPEFLMMSTHPLHMNFDTDLKRWKDKIKENMYDNFDMPNCQIVQESIGPEGESTATVQYIAEMIFRETGEATSFMETATFEKVSKTHGAWLYKNGTIEAAPGSDTLDKKDEVGDSGDQSMEEKLAGML